MPHVATLIPSSPVIPPLLFNQIMALLEEADHFPMSVDWLEPQRVVDIHMRQLPPPALVQEIRDTAAAFAADLIIQPIATRDKKMLISDMDSTMIACECIDELADYVGKKDEVSRITERAMNGELDFTAALNERVELLAGLEKSTLEACMKERVSIMPGAPELLAVMKAEGCYCLLVSGGFDFFTTRIAEALGFDAQVANRLEMHDGKLTGKVIPPIIDKDSKVSALLNHAAEQGVIMDHVLAVGDGANDLPMLKTAGLGIAYHAKQSVRQQAEALVDYNDLTALLYAQGYAPNFQHTQEST